MIQPHRAAEPREVVESPAIGDQVRARCLDGGLCLGEIVAIDVESSAPLSSA